MKPFRLSSLVAGSMISVVAHGGVVIAPSPIVTTEISGDKLEFTTTPPAYQLFAIDSKVGMSGRANLIRSGFQNRNSNTFSILLENGNNGVFSIPASPSTEFLGMQVPKQIDYNDDGVEDIVFLNKTNPNDLAFEFALFESTSLTDFDVVTGSSFIFGALSLDDGQFDNDMFGDVAVIYKSGAGSTASVFAWWLRDSLAGQYQLQGQVALPNGAIARGEDSLAVADYDLDGFDDVCIAAETPGAPTSNSMFVYLNDGSGAFPATPSAVTNGPPNSVGLGLRTADFNNDGVQDLLFLQQAPGGLPLTDPRGFPNIWFNKNDGSNTFNAPSQLLSDRFHHAEVADMDRDGDPDIVLARLIDANISGQFDDAEVVVLENVGLFSGTFTAITRSVPLLAGDEVFTLPWFPPGGGSGNIPYFDLAIGDFDGNGQLDIAVDCNYEQAFNQNDLFVWLNETPLPTPCECDVNEDNVVDLADLNLVLANFGSFVDPLGSDGDANMDGKVNLADLNLVLGNFGNDCGAVREIARDGGSDGEFSELLLNWVHLHGFETWQAWLAGVEAWEDDQIMEHMEFLAAFLDAVGGPPAE